MIGGSEGIGLLPIGEIVVRGKMFLLMVIEYLDLLLQHILPVLVQPLQIGFLSLSHLLIEFKFPSHLLQSNLLGFFFEFLTDFRHFVKLF